MSTVHVKLKKQRFVGALLEHCWSTVLVVRIVYFYLLVEVRIPNSTNPTRKNAQARFPKLERFVYFVKMLAVLARTTKSLVWTLDYPSLTVDRSTK